MAGDLDSATVARAQAGDEQARARLLEALQPILRAFFVKRIGRKTEVDDLVQNTLLRVHHGLEDLKDADRLKAFAMKAALFEVQDLYRGRYHAKEALYDPAEPPGHDEEDGAPTAGIDVERALAVLSPKARRIMELRAYGYKYAEIADVIGSTEAAIKMQVKRAFERMRDVLTAVLLAATGLLWC